MTLIEIVIATAILGVFITMASASIEVIMNQSTSLAQSAQAIDELQTAEQTAVRDIHAATAWCAGQSFTAPETQLQFVAAVNGSTPSFEITIANDQLTLAENTTGTCSWTSSQILVTGLDPATSGLHGSYFTIRANTSWTGGAHSPAVTYRFYTAVQVTLTVDSARRTIPSQIQTTIGDNVEIWNQEYSCQTDWVTDPPANLTGWTNPC
jgi:Tfp pilus assembly protein PilE